MTSANFKGKIGEEQIKLLLKKHGYHVYTAPNESHPFDFIGIKRGGKNEGMIIFAEAKAKTLRKYRPDTGVNFSHYKIYKEMSRTTEFWLFFVDAEEGSIYGNLLDKLDESEIIDGVKYPLIETTKSTDKNEDIIYWHRKKMIKFEDLSIEVIERLKGDSNG